MQGVIRLPLKCTRRYATASRAREHDPDVDARQQPELRQSPIQVARAFALMPSLRLVHPAKPTTMNEQTKSTTQEIIILTV